MGVFIMYNQAENKSKSRKGCRIELTKFDFNIKVSIDRLTIVASYDPVAFEKKMLELTKQRFCTNSGAGFQLLDTSQLVSDSAGDDIPLEQVAYLEVLKFDEHKIRIDFNPNHGMKSDAGVWLSDFIKRLTDKHYSRCDVAFDIFDYEPVKDYQVWQWGSSKKVWFGRDGKMETTYYGSPASNKQIRQYNKLVEQKRKGKDVVNHDSWWRIELQLRGNKIQDYPKIVKEMLENFYVPNYSQIEDVVKSAMVYRLVHDPSFYGNLGRSTQFRYRKLIKEVPHKNDLSIAMAQKFVEQFEYLENELQLMMRRFNIQATENDGII